VDHPDRTYGVKAVDSLSDLIEVLTNHKWPLCTGFEFDNFLYLNDSEDEDAPEYVAFLIDEVDGLVVSGRETGRIRPLGMAGQTVQEFVQKMRKESLTQEKSLRIKAEPDWHHACPLCKFEET